MSGHEQLSGVTVLDLSSVGPASRCTAALADLGASVVPLRPGLPKLQPGKSYVVEVVVRTLGLEVEFAGEVDPAPWYARMDVLVLTSRSEAQPLVALEAMSAGVPVVASDVGGCRELLAGAGLVTRPGRPAATAAAVLRVLGDETLRARLVAAGRTRIETRHDPSRMLRTFHELYEAAAV